MLIKKPTLEQITVIRVDVNYISIREVITLSVYRKSCSGFVATITLEGKLSKNGPRSKHLGSDRKCCKHIDTCDGWFCQRLHVLCSLWTGLQQHIDACSSMRFGSMFPYRFDSRALSVNKIRFLSQYQLLMAEGKWDPWIVWGLMQRELSINRNLGVGSIQCLDDIFYQTHENYNPLDYAGFRRCFRYYRNGLRVCG